jgi:hypothetical protein
VSQPLSTEPTSCRCVAGYKCTYRQDTRLEFRFNLALSQFTSQIEPIKAGIATVAEVPPSTVVLESSQSVMSLLPIPPPPRADM